MMKKLIVILCALCFTASVANADGVIKRRIVGGGAPPNIAFDAKSSGGYGTGNFSWTHTPVGTPRAVIVYVFQSNNGADHVATPAPTYGGVSMTEVTGSPLLKATGEAMAVYGYFLGSSIPAGAQTVAVTVDGTVYKTARCITLTATGDTAITDTTNISSGSVENPSATLALGGVESFALMGFVSGNEVASDLPANWTNQYSATPFDTTEVFRLGTYDIIGTANVTFGATQTADDFVAIGIAVRVAP